MREARAAAHIGSAELRVSHHIVTSFGFLSVSCPCSLGDLFRKAGRHRRRPPRWPRLVFHGVISQSSGSGRCPVAGKENGDLCAGGDRCACIYGSIAIHAFNPCAESLSLQSRTLSPECQ